MCSDDSAAILICLSVFALGIGIPSMIIGFVNEDAYCQNGTRGGLDLSDWIKGIGIEKVEWVICLWSCLLMTLFINGNFRIGVLITLICDVLFNSVWFVWGIILMVTEENRTCILDGTDLGIMSIIACALMWITVLSAVAFPGST